MTTAPDVRHFGGKYGFAPVIVATSCRNGLAFSAYQAWAFRRAELTPFVQTPFRCANGALAIMGPVRTLDPTAGGARRLLPLVGATLEPLLATIAALPRRTKVLFELCLPERMAGTSGKKVFLAQRDVIERGILDILGATAIDPILHVVPRGHASLAFAVLDAANAFAGGTVEVAVVGGVDTYYDPAFVQQLITEERLFDNENLDTPVGGEGAAFLVLATREGARALQRSALARIEGVGTGNEPATMDDDVPCLALGLSRPARLLAQRLEKEKRSLDWWITDVTAEALRTHELQLAWPRAARGVMNEHSAIDYMIESFGDLGAAVMPTAAALATEGFRRGDPAASTCMITGSSLGHDRGVLLLAKEG